MKESIMSAPTIGSRVCFAHGPKRPGTVVGVIVPLPTGWIRLVVKDEQGDIYEAEARDMARYIAKESHE